MITTTAWDAPWIDGTMPDVIDPGALIRWLMVASYSPPVIARRLGLDVADVYAYATGRLTPAGVAIDSVDDLLWQLTCTQLRGGHASKPVGRTDTCRNCGATVPLYVDAVDQLTSSGTQQTWSHRPAAMHNEACWTAFLAAGAARAICPDLWGA